MEKSRARVLNACAQHLERIRYYDYIDTPYCFPYMRYLFTWHKYLPIKTIIIGQNPYPQDIYPEIGAALSYDTEKIRGPPKSVAVIAEDLYNYNETDKESTISCMRDLWRMLENGVIAINENIFASITEKGKRKNTTSIKEAESQILLLRVLIAESRILGQEEIELMALGRSATAMVSVLRQWCPSDMIKLRCVTGINPAGVKNNSDNESQPITLRNNSVSKILSRIVGEYIQMPPKKNEKASQQNFDALEQATESIMGTSTGIVTETSSFMKRIRDKGASDDGKINIDDICEMMENVQKAASSHANAIRVHTMSFLINAKDIKKVIEKAEENAKKEGANKPSMPFGPPAPAQSSPVAGSGGRRRTRRVTTPNESPGNIDTIKEEVTPKQEDFPDPVLPSTPSRPQSVAPSVTPSTTGRRRVRRTASTVAPSEYTVEDKSEMSIPTGKGNSPVGIAESVHMKSIAQWFADNMQGNTTYSEILNSSAEERSVGSKLAQDVLDHIRERSSEATQYDAYAEIEDPSSKTSAWCQAYSATLSD